MDKPLQINTYSTVFEQSESSSIVKNNFIPENASLKERKIHDFLTKMCCFTVNIKTMLEDEAKKDC